MVRRIGLVFENTSTYIILYFALVMVKILLNFDILERFSIIVATVVNMGY